MDTLVIGTPAVSAPDLLTVGATATAVAATAVAAAAIAAVAATRIAAVRAAPAAPGASETGEVCGADVAQVDRHCPIHCCRLHYRLQLPKRAHPTVADSADRSRFTPPLRRFTANHPCKHWQTDGSVLGGTHT